MSNKKRNPKAKKAEVEEELEALILDWEARSPNISDAAPKQEIITKEELEENPSNKEMKVIGVGHPIKCPECGSTKYRVPELSIRICKRCGAKYRLAVPSNFSQR